MKERKNIQTEKKSTCKDLWQETASLDKTLTEIHSRSGGVCREMKFKKADYEKPYDLG